MHRKALLGLMLALLTSLCVAQQPLSQTIVMDVSPAPAAVINTQTASTTTGTGVSIASTGGSVAAGTYRICVTFFTATNTETPCSTDTAATSTVTTTGATSVVTVAAPVAYGAGLGANVVGYRVYVGASGGASAAETLQTLNSTVCTLSSSSTPSCALTSPAVFTASTNFSGGSGGPASPGTALYQPLNNAAATALYEGSLLTYHVVTWVVTGTAPGSCTFQIQQGSTIAGLANVGQAITCTSSGAYALPIVGGANYATINVSAFTAGGVTTQVTFTYQALAFPPSYSAFFGNAAPTGNCTNGVSYNNTAGASASTILYVCEPANTFTAVTVP